MTKPLPSTLSAHDLLKTFAVIIMIVDHIGYYFYPDDMWWRAVGRIGFPIWFYLVGHAASRELPAKLWLGAFFLLGMNLVVGLPVLPLNALFTIILLRLSIDYVMVPVSKKPELLWFVFIVCLLALVPTDGATEYGTQALLFAMFGYIVRHRATLPIKTFQVAAFILSIGAVFLAYQDFAFHFAPAQWLVMAAGTLIVCAVLYFFRPLTYPALDPRVPRPVKGFIRICGRHTLEIYVLHLTLFKLLALYIGMSGFGLFAVRLME